MLYGKFIFISFIYSIFHLQIIYSSRINDETLKNLLKSFDSNKNTNYGNLNSVQGRILNGVNAASNGWPWVVSVRQFVPVFNDYEDVCGGVLIYNRYILTAAHCAIDQTPQTIRIVMGVSDLGTVKSSNIYLVDKIASNKLFNKSNVGNGNDIALFRLKVSVTPSTKISSINLPNSAKDWNKVIGKSLFAVGWFI